MEMEMITEAMGMEMVKYFCKFLTGLLMKNVSSLQELPTALQLKSKQYQQPQRHFCSQPQIVL